MVRRISTLIVYERLCVIYAKICVGRHRLKITIIILYNIRDNYRIYIHNAICRGRDTLILYLSVRVGGILRWCDIII